MRQTPIISRFTTRRGIGSGKDVTAILTTLFGAHDVRTSPGSTLLGFLPLASGRHSGDYCVNP
ncbi:MAG: hypothetical protein WAS49_09310 [Candidatus Dechloromonas phosphoritropha]|nr:hypothetical protein [Candidatus Dechloromonas phosphoritropha]MBP8787514.1 hypothetical protein [Azonexus sp.]MBP9227764.1 hypothetical protein [Azonexus sp.]